MSVALAFGPHGCASAMNATVGGRPSGYTAGFTPMLFPEVLNANQGNSLHHFSSSGLAMPSKRKCFRRLGESS